MTYIRYKLVLLYSEEQPNLNLETEGKISQAVTNFLKHCYFRSSHLRCSVKKGVLRNFAKFAGKHLWQRFFFNKVAGQACNFIKKRAPGACAFLWILRNFSEHLFYRTRPDDCFCYFHIKQSILLIIYITHTRMQMATQSL